MTEPPIVVDSAEDLGVQLWDRFGNGHWVPLSKLIQVAMRVVAEVIDEQEGRGEKRAE